MKAKMLKLFLFLSLLFKLSICANILLYFHPYAKTHLISFLPLLQQLGKDGHNITVYYIDMKPPPPILGDNISVIDANILIVPKGDYRKKYMEILWTKTVPQSLLVFFALYTQKDVFSKILITSNDTYFQTITDKYDLAIVDERFTLHGIAAADTLKERKNVPYIIYSSSVQSYWYQSTIALSRTYSKNDISTNSVAKFVNRVLTTVENFVESFLMNLFVLFPTDKYDFEINRFYKEAHFTFGEHIDRLGNPITESSDLILVGSNCKSASASIKSELPKQWKTFIEDSKSKGTIYISMGSTVFWNYTPETIKNTFIKAVNELVEYRIIVSWNGTFPEDIKPHVKFTTWAPQMEILSHPKTKVFFTHGGLKSLKEAICSEVPVVLLPLSAEQTYNAEFGQSLGIGLILDKHGLSSEKIVTSIKEIANNEIYQQMIKKVKSTYLDRPMDATEYGSFQINKFLRERKKFGNFAYDSAHDALLKRKGRLLNNWQFYGFDLILVVACFIYLLSK